MPAPKEQASARLLSPVNGRSPWSSQTQAVSSQSGHATYLEIITHYASAHQPYQGRCGSMLALHGEPAVQSSRLAEFGGRGMSFNICRGTWGSFAILTARRNASSRDSRFIDIRRCGSSSK
jgi:hypothetical protein